MSINFELATLFGRFISNCSDVLHQIQALVHELLPSNTSTHNQLGTKPGSASSPWDGTHRYQYDKKIISYEILRH